MSDNSGKGILFIISAPSAAGKTTLAKHIVENVANIRQSVSYTTRSMRDGEIDGVDYNFIDQATFDRMSKENGFMEHACVHGNCYGTAFEQVEKAKADGRDLLLVIDVQGAAAIREKGVDQVSMNDFRTYKG